MPELQYGPEEIKRVGVLLCDSTRPLKERFRALFTLKNINKDECIKEIGNAFTDPSALLKHELAYCLGQMQNVLAIPILTKLLVDESQETIVRHEAAEALGAIGDASTLPLLEEFETHSIVEISETCQLAVERIMWSQANKPSSNQYHSVDPAPPMLCKPLAELTNTLLNESENLFQRYRAMFTLRDSGTEKDVLALCEGLKCRSALFRHEIAFVLGQIAHPVSIAALQESLADCNEKAMVRHECAEALGAIATDECFQILKVYTNDSERVVRESCHIALDMCEYENSEQFQYANGLSKP